MELDLLKPFFELKQLNKPTECYNCKQLIQPDDEFPAVADLYMKLIFKGKHVLCSRNCLKVKTAHYVKRENEGANLIARINAKLGVKLENPETPAMTDWNLSDEANKAANNEAIFNAEYQEIQDKIEYPKATHEDKSVEELKLDETEKRDNSLKIQENKLPKTTPETTLIGNKVLVHELDANHREGHCSFCDSKEVSYEARDNRTEELRARLCQNCYDNKWCVEWDARCGNAFHKING